MEFRSTSDFDRRSRDRVCGKFPALSADCMASRISLQTSARDRAGKFLSRPCPLPIGSLRKIDINPACERERDDERRRHEEIRLDVLMHARFEISISRKNRSRDQIVFVDRFLDLRMKRSGVADAGRATVTDKIKAKLIEIRLQSGFLEIIGNDARTRRQRSFHGGIDAQPALDRFFCKQTGREHHAGVAGVCATRDRRDQYAAVADMTASARENVARLRFDLPCCIGRWPVRRPSRFCCVRRPD